MNKYKVKNVYVSANGCNELQFSNGDKLFVPLKFGAYVRTGDTVHEYVAFNKLTRGMPLAYYCNGKMCMTVTPVTDLAIKRFPSQYLRSWTERLAFNIALMRTLKKNQIKPSLVLTNNLRKWLDLNQKVK